MNIRRLLIPMAVLAVCGLGVSAPAFAGEVAPVTASQSQAPRFQLSWTEHDGLITGGKIKLLGATVRILDGNLALVGHSGQTLEILPSRLPDAAGKLVSLLYDVSDPNDLVFKFVPIAKDRADFWHCAFGISQNALLTSAAGAGIGGIMGFVLPGIGTAAGLTVGSGVGAIVGLGVGVGAGITSACR